MLAIDLGTNGEVMVTDGERILVASTAAGPAFEGVNISCGTRAVDGAIIDARVEPEGTLTLTTIGDKPPVGLTGSGLISLVYELRRAGVIGPTGRFVTEPPTFGDRLGTDEQGVRRFFIAERADGTPLFLTQMDVRELQKAKGAIRAASEILLAKLGLKAEDLRRVILTGSFGSRVRVDAVLGLGMIPPVDEGVIETEANGAGFGAALFLKDEEFARGERIAAQAQQVDLDLEPDFNERFVEGMSL